MPVPHRKKAHGALTFTIEVVGTYYFSLLMTNPARPVQVPGSATDHVLMQGKEVVDRWLDGSEEKVFRKVFRTRRVSAEHDLADVGLRGQARVNVQDLDPHARSAVRPAG